MKLQTFGPQGRPPHFSQNTPSSGGPQKEVPSSGPDGYDPQGGVHQAALRSGLAWGDNSALMLGGATGMVSVVGALYAGALGGAVLGSLTGAGFGPIFSSLTAQGGLDFVGRTLQTTGFFAQAGIGLGAATGLAGAWQVGSGVGGALGRGLGFVPGYCLGGLQALGGKQSPVPAPPAPKPGQEPKVTDLNDLKGPMRVYAGALSAVGGLSGAAGGFTLGASLASAGSLASGLLTQNLNWANLGAAGLSGGLVGGALFASMGALGGFTLARGSQQAWNATAGKWLENASGERETQSAKAQRLDQLAQGLDRREDQLSQLTQGHRQVYRDNSAQLDQRDLGLGAQEVKIEQALSDIQSKIDSKGQALYAAQAAQPDPEVGQSLVDWNRRLQGWQGQLQELSSGQQVRERQLDQSILQGAEKKFSLERPALDQRYDTLQGQLNQREGDLNDKKHQIDDRIVRDARGRIDSQRPQLQQDLNWARSERDQAHSDNQSAQRDRSSAASQLNSAQSQLGSARSQAQQAQGQVNRLQSAINDLSNQESNLRVEHRQADSTTSELQRQLRDCRNH